jgi:hypothetical protein
MYQCRFAVEALAHGCHRLQRQKLASASASDLGINCDDETSRGRTGVWRDCGAEAAFVMPPSPNSLYACNVNQRTGFLCG